MQIPSLKKSSEPVQWPFRAAVVRWGSMQRERERQGRRMEVSMVGGWCSCGVRDFLYMVFARKMLEWMIGGVERNGACFIGVIWSFVFLV